MSAEVDDADDDLGEASQDELDTATVADPDNYNQSRRLRTIHDARDDVRAVKRAASARVDQVGPYKAFNEDSRDAHVAAAVVDYLLEIEPLLEQFSGESDGTLRNSEYDDLHEFLDDNLDPHDDPPPLAVSMAVYRECSRVLAAAGLGLDIDNGLPTDDGFDTTRDNE